MVSSTGWENRREGAERSMAGERIRYEKVRVFRNRLTRMTCLPPGSRVMSQPGLLVGTSLGPGH